MLKAKCHREPKTPRITAGFIGFSADFCHIWCVPFWFCNPIHTNFVRIILSFFPKIHTLNFVRIILSFFPKIHTLLGVSWVLLVPQGKRVMGARWVFVKKRTPDGKLIKLKARYVAKGYAQVAGVEFLDTFAPTETFLSLRLLLTVAAKCNWPVYSSDFVAAYLHSPIDEEVWVRPPEGLNVPKGHAFKLQKELHGTKQAARCWWKHLQSKLKGLGYLPSQFDSSLYILKHPDQRGAIWIHVDDGVVTGSSDKILKQLEQDLKECLEIK
jgi:hypothetical protein